MIKRYIRQILIFCLITTKALYAEDTVCTDLPSCLRCDSDGITFCSADDFLSLNITTLIQADARIVSSERLTRGANSFFIRRARLIFEGKVGSGFSFRMTPDFALGGHTHLFDAWVQYDFNKELSFRFGKMRPPLGLERLAQESDLKFIQRGLPSNLVPIREIGFMVCGRVFEERIDYEIGIFNGSPDLGLSVNDSNNAKDVEGRFFYFPFKHSCWPALKEFAIGCAGGWGVHSGGDCLDGPEVPVYFTPGFLVFFRYRPSVVADGSQWRLIPQGYWYSGPWGLLWECALSSLKVKNRIFNVESPITNKAWQIQFSYELTGEKNTFGRIIPLTTLDLCKGTWGGFEFVARYEELYIDGNAFPIYADPNCSAQIVRSGGIGLNWYPNLYVKISGDFEISYFKRGGRHHSNRPAEYLLLLQAQTRF